MINTYHYINTATSAAAAIYTFTADGVTLPPVGTQVDAAVTNSLAVGTVVHIEELHTNEWNIFVSPTAAVQDLYSLRTSSKATTPPPVPASNNCG